VSDAMPGKKTKILLDLTPLDTPARMAGAP
jgi:hypothetical protein